MNGAAGVTGVAGIDISMGPARRESLLKLLAPADPGSWDPPLVFVEGQRFQVQAIRVKVRDVAKAEAAIPAALPVVFVPQEIGTTPSATPAVRRPSD